MAFRTIIFSVWQNLLALGSLNAGDFRINEDAAAVFADDDFLVHLDFELLLRGDTVEAAAAGVALDVNNTQTVAGIFADALEGIERIGVDFRLELLGLLTEALLVLTGFGNNLLELGTLFGEHVLGVLNALFGSLDFSRFVLDLARIVVDVFLAKLDFEGLELYFLGEKVELAVIAHVVELLLIGSDFALRINDFLALLHEFVVEGGDFGLVVFDTGVQALSLIHI